MKTGTWRDAMGALKGVGRDEPAEVTIRRARGWPEFALTQVGVYAPALGVIKSFYPDASDWPFPEHEPVPLYRKDPA